jgi:hypothetical protein
MQTASNNSSANFKTVYKDMYDGTIRKSEVRQFIDCLGSTQNKEKDIVYIKKCLQGQIYRSTQNDCQDPSGGRNAGNNWGALTFQFCTTNDGSCETNWKADPIKNSPAAVSCANDTLANRKWHLYYNQYDTFIGNFNQYFPDIPIGATNLIWSSYSDGVDPTLAEAYYFDVPYNKITFTNKAKINTYYVLCLSE